MARKAITDINAPGFFDDDNLDTIGVPASQSDAALDFLQGLPDDDGSGGNNASRPIDGKGSDSDNRERVDDSSLVMPGGRVKPGDAAAKARDTDSSESEDDDVDDDDLDDDDDFDDDLDDDEEGRDELDENEESEETPAEKRERLRYANHEEAERAYRELQAFTDRREAERQQQLAQVQQQLQQVQQFQQQAQQVPAAQIVEMVNDDPRQAFQAAAQFNQAAIPGVIARTQSNATHYDVQASLANEAGDPETAQQCANYANYLRTEALQMQQAVFQAEQMRQQQPIVDQHALMETASVASTFEQQFPRSTKYNQQIVDYISRPENKARFNQLDSNGKFEFMKDTYYRVRGEERDKREADRNARRRSATRKVAGGGVAKSGKRGEGRQDLTDEQKEATATRRHATQSRERSNAIFNMGTNR